ncbi:MAG: hypothetical protein Q8L85_07790 [Alphaproteobacteria bacterium]|nr:hypothetical protein [Alphaproteobacteria bacterium]
MRPKSQSAIKSMAFCLSIRMFRDRISLVASGATFISDRNLCQNKSGFW